MPFMLGPAPVRRTLKYLHNCKIHFRENVRIFTISYSKIRDNHLGASEFVFWHLPQVQYNNPTVQFVKLQDFTPTPFIKIYLENKKPILIDLDCRTKDEIRTHLENMTSVTKTRKEIEVQKKKDLFLHSSYFGTGCHRHCLCEINGQIPCPSIVPLPKTWRGIQSKEKTLQIPPHILLWLKKKIENPQSEE